MKRKLNVVNSVVKKQKWLTPSSLTPYILNDIFLDIIKTKKGVKRSNDNLPYYIKKGIEFEDNIYDSLKKKFKNNVVKVCDEYTDLYKNNKYKKTLSLMKKGKKIIYQGIVKNHKNKTHGIPDFIVRSDFINKIFKKQVIDKKLMKKCAKKINKKYHYVILDVKCTTLKLCSNELNIQNTGFIKQNKAQMYIYNQALGMMQGYTPQYSYILAKRTTHKKKHNNKYFYRAGVIDFLNFDKKYSEIVQTAIEQKRDMNIEELDVDNLNKINPDFAPNMCNTYDLNYHGVKKEYATKNKDITLLWRCGPKHRRNAFVQKVYKYDDDKCNVDVLGFSEKSKYIRKRLQPLIEINREKKDKIKIIENNNLEILYEEDCQYLYVDFETITDTLLKNNECVQLNYLSMIGVGWIEKNVWKFKSFVMEDLTTKCEKIVLNEFKQFIAKFKKTKILHWVIY